MPLYFAYGSNMDGAAMRQRCPNARPLGRARLARHKFFIMRSGFASVKRDQRTDVHGVLYDLAFSDIPGLDRYEETGSGLYTKVSQSVLRDTGAPVRALVYIGASQVEGMPAPAYLQGIVAAAKDWALPEDYINFLGSFGGAATEPGGISARRWRAIQLKDV